MLPDNVSVSGYHSVVIDPPGAIRVTFYPGAIDVCGEKKFEDGKKTIPFKVKKPPSAPTTKQVSVQWYCRLDSTEWEQHKPAPLHRFTGGSRGPGLRPASSWTRRRSAFRSSSD